MSASLWLLPCAGVLFFNGNASGFHFQLASRPTKALENLFSTATPKDTGIAHPLGGVVEFEEWFSFNSSSGARFDNVRHALFDSMGRGLQFTSKKSSDLQRVAVVPRKLVLNVPFSDENDSDSNRAWDTNLSLKLWNECQKGRESAYYGYCSLLTRGANLDSDASFYPATAPDALRHWTDSQKSRLLSCDKGKKLVQIEQRQQEEWKQKYESLSSSEKEEISWENFQWALEAVHSRAFKGDFGALDGGAGGPLRKIASLLLPFSALAFGVSYASSPLDPSMDKYFLPLAVVAALPVALTTIADQKGSKEAVMLPLIDSANHLQEADSVIEYDPSLDGFVLSLGRKCLVKEVDESGERAQVCISYGLRKDSELLLNYGFVRGVTMEGMMADNREKHSDEVRQKLAEAYIARNQ